MNQAVVVCAKRTAIGKSGGILKQFSPEKMAAAVINTIIEETEIKTDEIDDVLLGNVIGPGGNIARLSLLTAGLPVSVPGVTIDRQCGSGLEAINIAARLIEAGAGEMYLAGGVESVSLAPWKMEKPLNAHTSSPRLYERARFSPDSIGDPEMGEAAENVAEAYHITREDQDEFALRSHQKASAAIDSGVFHGEVVPLYDGTSEINKDECPRKKTSMRLLKRLPTIFRSGGTVTAGNSCPTNDGAAVLLITSRKKALALGLEPLAALTDSVTSGVDPNLLGIGPVPAVEKLLQRKQRNIQSIDIMEFNEAFASQVLASLRVLRMPEEKVNLNGGGIALGHPYGASGAVIAVRLCHEMKRGEQRCGIATMGIGGGMGIASMFEKV
ncbi:thiolase family protein [Alteribacillus sp. HJP-4]|uniref:thiolase family protein n=1 Tax=Alteribacillus sp. HJP-4 TaxID=2775394 RepID=UPI0035CCFA85